VNIDIQQEAQEGGRIPSKPTGSGGGWCSYQGHYGEWERSL